MWEMFMFGSYGLAHFVKVCLSSMDRDNVAGCCWIAYKKKTKELRPTSEEPILHIAQYIPHTYRHVVCHYICTNVFYFLGLFLDCADTSTVPLRLAFIPCINKDYSLQTLATLPLLLRRAHSPCISYHFKSACLKTSRPCGSRVHCGSRRKEWFRGPQPRHFPPEQPLTRSAINH